MTLATRSGRRSSIRGLRYVGPEIPASHRDLVECPPVGALTTVMPDGMPQTSVVWCDFDGTFVRVNTMRGFQKERNIRRNPRVTLLCYDPRAPYRYLEVRGRVESMTEDGAMRHLDELGSKYVGRSIRYFGDAIPARFAETEIPVLCRIRPVRVVALDGSGGEPEPTPASTSSAPAPTSTAAVRSPATDSISSSTRSAAPTPVIDTASTAIPASHADLLTRPICGVMTTMAPDGQPESSLVWLDLDADGLVRAGTTLERRKGRNLAANPRVCVLVVDPENTGRFIQVRGVAELVTDRAVEHLDALTRAYTDHPAYYGHVYPAEQAEHETRVIVRIHARRVQLDAIHA